MRKFSASKSDIVMYNKLLYVLKVMQSTSNSSEIIIYINYLKLILVNIIQES